MYAALFQMQQAVFKPDLPKCFAMVLCSDYKSALRLIINARRAEFALSFSQIHDIEAFIATWAMPLQADIQDWVAQNATSERVDAITADE